RERRRRGLDNDFHGPRSSVLSPRSSVAVPPSPVGNVGLQDSYRTSPPTIVIFTFIPLSKRTRSASAPARSTPFFFSSPSSFAGAPLARWIAMGGGISVSAMRHRTPSRIENALPARRPVLFTVTTPFDST